MNHRSRGQRLNAAFVAVADTLSDDYNADDLMRVLLQECTAVLQLQDGGVALATADGGLRRVAPMSGYLAPHELFELDTGSGPAGESFSTGTAVLVDDLDANGERWPEFRRACLERGVLSAYALPLRLRDQVVGTLSVYGTSVAALDTDGAAVAQALADVASIGYLHEREIRETAILAAELERELAHRIRIEQAKGMLIGTGAGTAGDALAMLESHARAIGLSTLEVAESIIARRVVFTGDSLEEAPAA